MYTSRSTRVNSTHGEHEKVKQKSIRHPEGKRQVDRTGRRREDNIKIDLSKYVTRRKGCN